MTTNIKERQRKARWVEANKEKIKEYHRQYYRAKLTKERQTLYDKGINPLVKQERKPKKKRYDYIVEQFLNGNFEPWKRRMLVDAKARAKRKDLEFNLSLEDIIIPSHCPIIGTPLMPKGDTSRTKAALDRIDNSKGYIKGNIRVISSWANLCKSDLSLQAIENLYLYSVNRLP